jgi:hypothetical protein
MQGLTQHLFVQGLASRELLTRMYLVYVILLLSTHTQLSSGPRIMGGLIAVVGLLMPGILRFPYYWLLFATALAGDLYTNYSGVANHYWLTVYTTLYFAVDAWRQERGEALAFNLPRALLIVTFGFATFHKLASSYFMSGRLLGQYFMGGHALYIPLSWIYPGLESSVQSYHDAKVQVDAAPIFDGYALPFDLPGEHFALLCATLTVSIAILELVIVAVLVIRPSFQSAVLPAALIAFVWGTFTVRGEYTFFSLVMLLTLLARPSLEPIWRLLLYGSLAIFMALDVAGMGALLS